MNSLNIPSDFKRNIISLYGDGGREWIHKLPRIMANCLKNWELKYLSGMQNLSHSHISVVSNNKGKEMILKLAYPDEPEFLTEIETLTLYEGKNSVKLLDFDKIKGALLLEKIYPGTSLRSLKNAREATKIAGSLMKQLLYDVPHSHSLPAFANWAEVVLQVKPKIPQKYFHIYQFAEQLINSMIGQKEDVKLLHGDLHHENILYDEQRGWLAIDPKGLIGPTSYQASRFLRNFWGEKPNVSLFQERVEIIAKALEKPPYDLAAYAYLDFVIGNSWIFEESIDHKLDLELEHSIRSTILTY